MTTQLIASAPYIATQVKLVTWNAHANGDTGAAWELNEMTDNVFAVSGTFGVAGSITLQGSLDGTNYFTMHDPLGNALTFTAAGLKQILEVPRYMRATVTAGDGTTALVPLILGRRNAR